MTTTTFRLARKGRGAFALALRRLMALAFPHWGFWALTLTLILVDLIADMTLPSIGFAAQCYTQMLQYVLVALAMMAWRFLRFETFDWFTHRAWCIVMLIAWVATSSKAVGYLGIALTALRLPLFSEQLISSDKALGFDWNTYASLILSRPWSENIFYVAYNGLADAAIKVAFALPILFNSRARLLEASFLAASTGLACSIIGALVPAYPAFNTIAEPALTEHLLTNGHFSLGGVADFFSVLRAAPYTLVTPDLIVGLVNFPSYHCCVALIIIVTTRGLGVISHLTYGAGLLVIMATPVFGGHYFSDLLGGAAITAVCVLIWHKYFAERIADSIEGTRASDYTWPAWLPLHKKLTNQLT